MLKQEMCELLKSILTSLWPLMVASSVVFNPKRLSRASRATGRLTPSTGLSRISTPHTRATSGAVRSKERLERTTHLYAA